MKDIKTLTDSELKEIESYIRKRYNDQYKSVRVTPLTHKAIKSLSSIVDMNHSLYINTLMNASGADWTTPNGLDLISRRPEYDLCKVTRVFTADYIALRRLSKASKLPVGIVLECIIAHYGNEFDIYEPKTLLKLENELSGKETNNAT